MGDRCVQTVDQSNVQADEDTGLFLDQPGNGPSREAVEEREFHAAGKRPMVSIRQELEFEPELHGGLSEQDSQVAWELIPQGGGP